MIIHRHPLTHYVKLLRSKIYFSFAGYSDAEWLSIMGVRLGNKTGLGQVLDGTTGQQLLTVLRRRQNDHRFLVAVPSCLWNPSDPNQPFIGNEIDDLLERHHIVLDAYERDMVLDDAARKAELFPLIDQLRKMRVVVIGPSPLRRLITLFHYDEFFEISTPNFHLELDGLDLLIPKVTKYGVPAVYLVSAGVSAALIIDRLHDQIPSSTFIDCGSIWDAFVGIGGQREWRQKLYNDPTAWTAWLYKNATGKEYR